MSLEAKINEDIKKAMLAKEQGKLMALRAVKSAILLAKTEKGGATELAAEQEIALLQKLVKHKWMLQKKTLCCYIFKTNVC